MTKQELFDLFEQIRGFSTTQGEQGVTRLAFSAEDEAAHQFIIEQAKKLGLAVRQDQMGNVFARLEGLKPELAAIATGSHLDSVPNGGAYDGILGVLTALYALSQFKKNTLKRSLELIVFRAEESSRFGFACMGSKVLTGMADIEKWRNYNDKEGVNFFQAINHCGYSSDNLLQCQLNPSDYAAFIETHIEQGAVLENAGKMLGLVTGIAAPSRFKVKVIGQADHSGATPMNQRHDALVASAEMVRNLYYRAQAERLFGSVATIGKLDVFPNVMNVIPGRVEFFVDIRGVDTESIQRLVSYLSDELQHIEQTFAVTIELLTLGQDQPVLLNEELIKQLELLCQQKHIDYQRIISGAGHDAMYMARLFPTCMIFTSSHKGISHHPNEYTPVEDISVAADLLVAALERFANA